MRPGVTLSLLRHGYRFEAHLAESGGSPATTTVRVLGRSALLVSGEDAVRLFYDQDVMIRDGAVPGPLSDELFGAGAVHLAALGPADVSAFVETLERSWGRVVGEGAPRPGRELFDVLTEVLGAAALDGGGPGRCRGEVTRRHDHRRRLRQRRPAASARTTGEAPVRAVEP